MRTLGNWGAEAPPALCGFERAQGGLLGADEPSRRAGRGNCHFTRVRLPYSPWVVSLTVTGLEPRLRQNQP